MEKLDFFAPRISADTKMFWEGCKEHKLEIQRCKKCGKLRWPAAFLCPDCLSSETEMQEMSGEGTLYSYVTFQKAFHPSVQDKVPYTVGVVEMEGGVRIISNIVDCEPEQLACNKKLKMKWMDCEEYTKPVFELVEEA